MSCGKCPKDIFRAGPTSGMRSYGGTSNPSYGLCGPRPSQINHYLRQSNQQTSYGRQGVKMRQYIPQRQEIATNYVKNLYAQTEYRPHPFTQKLEEKLSSFIQAGLEGKIKPEYKSFEDLARENDEIIDLAQRIAEKRRTVESQLQQLKEKQAA